MFLVAGIELLGTRHLRTQALEVARRSAIGTFRAIAGYPLAPE